MNCSNTPINADPIDSWAKSKFLPMFYPDQRIQAPRLPGPKHVGLYMYRYR